MWAIAMAYEIDAIANITHASACYKVEHCVTMGGGVNIANTLRQKCRGRNLPATFRSFCFHAHKEGLFFEDVVMKCLHVVGVSAGIFPTMPMPCNNQLALSHLHDNI